MKIQDTTAFVTGANRGIGKALVEELLAGGAKKIYATARDTSKLPFTDPRVVKVQLDVTDDESVTAATQDVGDVELLINNAGVNAASTAFGDIDGHRSDLEVNYFGVLRVSQALAETLKANQGTIVNLNSLVSLASMAPIASYGVSKAASHSLTLALRAELAESGVSVHGVYAGPIDTDMAKDMPMAKATPADAAAAILDGVEAGETHIAPDAMAQEVVATWRNNPVAVEEMFASM
ncbi:SDR family oxidoreductase [Algisphaera agarilytica]|uniref:NAD(P)-dependent dehydrogenase (Short-subunit alcohol dehydrogenase family) n=1 Tax=Algisphaera agarilytica TaxID=1385975 RepID=A0A7X0H883_9BACT|nr:SDR family oxidoreductase [Algisphaera agarilytica]MBB6429921.1 NAD(P)-dependent dehydrogenase (short-subunit alcohol dehydrogenase family) [Algisphaera agarilytica]